MRARRLPAPCHSRCRNWFPPALGSQSGHGACAASCLGGARGSVGAASFASSPSENLWKEGAAHPMAQGGFVADQDTLKKLCPAKYPGITCDAPATCPVAPFHRTPVAPKNHPGKVLWCRWSYVAINVRCVFGLTTGWTGPMGQVPRKFAWHCKVKCRSASSSSPKTMTACTQGLIWVPIAQARV